MAQLLVMDYNKAFIFNVRACEGIAVSLFDSPSPTKFVYEFEIGALGNTISRVRNKDGFPFLVENTPDILNCDRSVAFWVTWEQASLDFGIGEKFTNRLFGVVDPDFTMVHAVKIESRAGEVAEWNFNKLPGYFFIKKK